MSLDKKFYPMNQDGLAPDTFLYANALMLVCDRIRRAQHNEVATEDEALAQVEKDLRQMLDGHWRPS